MRDKVVKKAAIAGLMGAKKSKAGFIYGGNGSTTEKGSELALFFDRLEKKGKKPMVALVAIISKIVVISNARIKEEFFMSNKIIV